MNNANWEECLEKQKLFYEHYSLELVQRKALFDIACTLKPKSVIVELGTCNGTTSIVLAYVATKNDLEYTGIDSFILENTYDNVSNLLDQAQVKYTLLNGWTNEVPWNKKIDLLLVDASHTIPWIKQDCERWLPFINEGGYVAFHDYNDPYDITSSHWAVRYYADLHTGTWKDIAYVLGPDNNPFTGLKIRQKIITKPDFKFDLYNVNKP